MNNERLVNALSVFNSALDKLNESLTSLDMRKDDDEYYSLFEDAVIKRFEIAFEYCWKFIKVAVEFQGGEAFGPRPAIQEATRFGWIDDPEFWAEALDARNGSVHDYFGLSRMDYLRIVRKFAKVSQEMVKRIEGI